MANSKDEIVFNWKESKNHITSPITSVQGGVWKGDLVVNLLFEKQGLPTTQKVKIVQGGIDVTGAESSQLCDIEVEVVGTITLNYHSAIEIGQWLVKKGEELKKGLVQNSFPMSLN